VIEDLESSNISKLLGKLMADPGEQGEASRVVE
jgi:hypothetical protein